MAEREVGAAAPQHDEAERKIDALLQAIQQAEASPAAQGAAPGTMPPSQEVGEEDYFVDLEADLLEQSADALILDDSNTTSLEVELEEMEGAAAIPAQQPEPPAATTVAPPLAVSPAASPRTPSRFAAATPLLATLALLLGAASLWLTMTRSPAMPGAVVADAGEDAQAAEIRALRQRLAALEAKEDTGAESLRLLESMSHTLGGMEQRLAQMEQDTQPGEPTSPLDASMAGEPQASHQAVPAPVHSAEGGSSTPQGGDKTFIQGWAVNLRSFYRRRDAEVMLAQYHQAGIDAEIREIPKDDVTWYRLRVMGFADRKAASDFIAGLSPALGRDAAWPSYYEGYVAE